MTTDINAFVGSYPWRRVPGTSPEAVLREMDRVGIREAWLSHLPSLFWKDPASGNPWLYELASREARFRPVPAVHPAIPGWEETVSDAVTRGAPAIRCDPMFQGEDPAGAGMRRLVALAGELGIPVVMAVRLEDIRQRHPNDVAPDLPASAVRTLVRSHPRVRLVVTHADRGFIEEVHFGSTPAERARLFWDICWIWGPPEDHLAILLRTIGASRFLFGTGMPLRIPDSGFAKLDLSGITRENRELILEVNASTLGRRE